MSQLSPASLSRDLQTRLDILPSMTSEGKLTAYATPWAKQFQVDIDSF